MEEEIIAKELLEILACPACKTDVKLLEYKPGQHGLKCINCSRIYPVKDGIPVMLLDQAIKED